MFVYGAKIKQLRLNAKKTQAEFAFLLGMEQPNYQRLERGILDIRISMLSNICNTLGISADWLLGIDRGEDTAALSQANQMRNEIYRTSKALQKGGLSESDKQAIIDQLQALIDQLNK